MRQLQERIALAGPMQRDGNWVVGNGCRKHAFDTLRAAIAINPDDGRLLVAMTSGGAVHRLCGEALGPLPAAIAEILREAQSSTSPSFTPQSPAWVVQPRAPSARSLHQTGPHSSTRAITPASR